MSRMLRLEVAVTDAAELSRLVFEVGFSGLQEEPCAGDPRRLVFSTHLDPESGASALEQRLLDACVHHGVAVEVSHVEVDDAWKTAWTTALEPVVVNSSLRLVPGPPPGAREPGDLYLERALAFGYGEHPTTLMALRWLHSRVAGCRVLDVGTGTGVLALASAHWGASRAIGIDLDAPSVEAAQRNALLNGLEARCRFTLNDSIDVEGEFDVIVANIDALTLQRLATELCAHLRPGGTLALTGLLVEQIHAVSQAFARSGAVLHRVEQSGDWVLLAAATFSPAG